MDKETFWNLINGLQIPIYRFALSILKNKQEAEDAVHDIFLKLWYRRYNMPNTDTAKLRYALATTKNYCIDTLRKRKEKVILEPHHSISKNETELERMGTMEIIGKRISELPMQQRMVIELKDFQDYSYEEISQIMGVPVTTLRVNLSRARKHIINALEND